MAESTKLRRGRGKPAEEVAPNGRAEDEGAEPQEESQDAGGESSSGQGKQTLSEELRDTIREAAIEVLRPVARKATTSAAKYAVMKGPDLVKDRVAPKIAEAGGAGALAKGVADKGGGLAGNLGGGLGGVASSVSDAASGITEKLGGKGKKGKSPTGTGRGRRLPVQVFVDVAADIETTYDQFTQFEDWPQFMHRVEKIEQRDDATLMWHENIWGVRRSWEAEITEQTPCERIAWRSKGGPQTVGVATFHRLSDRLTRVYVNLDFQPKGLFEKTASGMRLSRRALVSDLMRFKAFVEMRDDTTGSWRGRIEDGEVVDEGDEQDESAEGGEETSAQADEEDVDESEDEDVEDEEPSASEEDEEEPASEEEDFEDEDEVDDDEEPTASAEDEDEADVEEEPEAAADDSDEEEEEPPAPARKRPPRRRTRSTSRSARSGG